MRLPVKIVDWHYYAFYWPYLYFEWRRRMLGFEAKGWQTYGVGLVTWIISFWLAGFIIRRALKMMR